MEEGFTKADSGNLPKVTEIMIMQFYVDNADYFSAEIRNVKAQKATKDSHGDNEVEYVQVKREADMCIVRGKLTPEHKIRQKPYVVEIRISEAEESVVSTNCLDCAASKGGCKHAIAFLFWLHRRSEEPACTSVTSYWQKSALSKIGQHKMDLGSIFDIKLAESDWPDTSQKYNFSHIPSGVITEVLQPPEANLSVYQMWLQFREGGGDTENSEKFLEFMSNCSKGSLWYELWFGRISASILYEAYKCKTAERSLLEKIMGACKKLETKAVKRGSLLEEDVLKRVSEIKGVQIQRVGIILNKKFPIFGASPDGICEEYCIEIKCPSSEKSVKNYIKGNKISNKYFYQLQMQMFFANKSKGLFCVASPNFEQDKEVNITEVYLNRDEIENILKGCLEFWKLSVYKALKNFKKF